jgi:FdhD protein
MGYQIAQRIGITMIGRATGRHYLLFTGEDHFARNLAEVSSPPEDGRQ